MIETALCDAIVAYAREKFAEERYPLAPALRPVREALANLTPMTEPVPSVAKRYPVPAQNKRRR